MKSDHIIYLTSCIPDAFKITEKSHITNDLGLDSLDQVDIVMSIEDKFDLEFSDEDASSITTIDEAVKQVAYISSHSNDPGLI